MADGDCVETGPDPEVATKRSLHRRLPAGNGQAKRSREVVDNVFERVQVRDRGEEVWAMQELGDRLTISDINTGDAELLEESKDFGGRLMRDRAGESIRQHAYPDRRVGGMAFPILDGLDGWDVVVGEVVVLCVVIVVVVVLFLLDLLVVLLVKPREANQVDGSELNASFVEEFDNLGTNVSSQNAARRDGHAPDHEYCPNDHPGRACDPRERDKASSNAYRR